MKTIDYKILLKKYINHVGEIEGTVFISPKYFHNAEWEDGEWEELIKLSEEKNEDNRGI